MPMEFGFLFLIFQDLTDAQFNGSLFKKVQVLSYNVVTKPQLGHQIRIILAIKGIL